MARERASSRRRSPRPPRERRPWSDGRGGGERRPPRRAAEHRGAREVPGALVLAFVLAVAAAPALPAEEARPPEAAAKVEPTETLYSLILKGGGLMLPIGLCSVVVLTLALERAVSLRSRRTAPGGLLEALYETLPRREATAAAREEALELLEASRSILGAVLHRAVLKLHRDAGVAETVVQDAATRELHLLRRRLRPFSVVANVAPLLGLLGTIYGMIVCFENVASTEAASRAETLAAGIYQALVTTAAGLTVAIPSLLVFHFFQGKVDRIADQLEEAGVEFLDHYWGGEPPGAPSGARRQAASEVAGAGSPEERYAP